MFGAMRSWFGSRARLYPFECHILSEVKSHLNAEGKDLLTQQVKTINKIQRLSDGKEVNLYRIRRGKPAFDDSIRFPNTSDEALLASAFLALPNNKDKLKAEVWMAKGRLFSLVFSRPPKKFFSKSGLNLAEPKIVDLKLWADPMRHSTKGTGRQIGVLKLSGWLREWYNSGIVSELCAPLSELECAEYIKWINSRLPSDYIELVSQVDGARIKACIVYGFDKIRELVWPNANYYALAELEGVGLLAVKEGMQDGGLYLLSYEDDNVRMLGFSFRKSILSLLGLEMNKSLTAGDGHIPDSG